MRISLKHLIMGMSLGAVMVYIYGFHTLKPKVNNPTQTTQNATSEEVGETPAEELIEPKIVEQINGSINKQAQYLEINKLNFNDLETDGRNTSRNPINNAPPTLTKTQTVAKITIAPANPGVPQNTNINASEDIINLIEKYSSEYGVNKDMMIGIAKCESGFRENAINGPYAGIYQFVSGTWISNRRAMGVDENLELRYNAEESVKTAAFKMSRDGFGAWPVCQHKAKGLVATAQNI